MRRREFISLLGGAAVAWPLAAGAQQSATPVIGYLRSGSRAAGSNNEVAFRQGLGSMGFVEGRNVVIEYRYDENQYERLPGLAADLIRSQVYLLYAANNRAAVTLRRANTTIPAVFSIGGDPVQLGLVKSLSRPEGNMTGVSFLQTATAAIRVQMLHEAVPKATLMGVLVNPANPNAEPETRGTQEAARKLGLQLYVVSASNNGEIDAAFATLVQHAVEGLIIIGDPLFTNRRQQVAALTVRHAIPAITTTRQLPDAGLLMSYGASSIDADRLGGIYAGRVLKGDKPADLPVQQAVKVELIINLIIAKVLGIAFPLTLLGRADSVIE